jgi:hypothetical protein
MGIKISYLDTFSSLGPETEESELFEGLETA